jgi:hypothetical protein
MTDSLGTDLQDSIPAEPVISEGVANQNDETLDKATVSKIVARERAKAYEKGKQEALVEREQQEQQQQQQAPQQQAPQQVQTLGGIQQTQQMGAEDIQRMIAEHVPHYLQAQAEEYKNKQFVESFVGKMQAAEKQYPGLEKKLDDLDFSKEGTQKLVQMANNMDNTGDIMNELIENPEKMGILLNLIHEQPKLAMQRMASIGNSIKTNREALDQEQSAQQPIGQLKSSINAGVDDHNLSVKDLKKLLRQGR